MNFAKQERVAFMVITMYTFCIGMVKYRTNYCYNCALCSLILLLVFM